MKTQRPLYSLGNFWSACWPCRPLPRSPRTKRIKAPSKNLKVSLDRPRARRAGQPILRRGGRSCDLLRRPRRPEGSGNRTDAGIHGSRSSTISPASIGPSRSPPRIPTSSTSAPGEANIRGTSNPASASSIEQRRQILAACLEAKGPDRPHDRPSHQSRVATPRSWEALSGPISSAASTSPRRRQDLEAGAQKDADTGAIDISFDTPTRASCGPLSGRRAAPPWGLTSGVPAAGPLPFRGRRRHLEENRPAAPSENPTTDCPRASGAGSASRSPQR